MADGLNNARVLRVLEILNDFRTLQMHITTYLNRPGATASDAASQQLVGYRTLQQCRVSAQRILALRYDPGNMGIQPNGPTADTREQRTALQRIILDVSMRRFQAHKIYLIVGSCIRWIQGRAQVLQGQRPNASHTAGLQRQDRLLQQEMASFTDQYVFNDLRNNDRQRGYWLNDDPSLEQILAWSRQQR